MPDFKKFAAQVRAQFELMSEHELYTLELNDSEEVWNMYLDSFPAGTNEIFRERRYYDGSYDRNVIRQIGNLAAIIDNKLVTIWDTPNTDYPFADTLAKVKAFVETKQINGFASIAERNLGHIVTTEKMADGSTHIWHHFNAEVKPRHLNSVTRTAEIAQYNTNIEMFKRALETFKDDNVETVLELISSNTLYRGSEFEGVIKAYQGLVEAYNNSSSIFPDYLIIAKASQAAARIRNTVIGTLIEDLNTIDLETAVKRYEVKVAPTNYRRPTALVTQGMINNAVQKLRDLGLEPSLERRYAQIKDVSVNDVIWVNNDAAKHMKGSLESLLEDSIKPKAKPFGSGAQDITIEEFIQNVLPKTTKLEINFANKHKGNLVSLTAGVNQDAENLFKWDNHFAWSYNGDVADSFISERVKTAGGNIDAALRVSLAWHNTDDLDIHCQCPQGHIYYGNRSNILDIDANAGGRTTTTPVENMQWREVPNGTYTFSVNQFSKRNTSKGGFTLELATEDGVKQYHYNKMMNNRETLECLKLKYSYGKLVELQVSDLLESEDKQEKIWGIMTGTAVEVSTVMLSPNHWGDNSEGNKHYIFAVKGCTNPDEVRGFYNEYLRNDLTEHRKVFEILGSKTKAPYSEEQISGLGFSSTRSDEVQFKATTDNGTRTYNVKF